MCFVSAPQFAFFRIEDGSHTEVEVINSLVKCNSSFSFFKQVANIVA
jgi:hypothetical protein